MGILGMIQAQKEKFALSRDRREAAQASANERELETVNVKHAVVTRDAKIAKELARKKADIKKLTPKTGLAKAVDNFNKGFSEVRKFQDERAKQRAKTGQPYGPFGPTKDLPKKKGKGPVQPTGKNVFGGQGPFQ